MHTKDAIKDTWTENVDLHVNVAMNVGKVLAFFKKGNMVIVLTGWHPGSGFTNTMYLDGPLEPLF